MFSKIRRSLIFGFCAVVISGILAVSLACASSAPTATPMTPAQPAQPSAPTAVPVVQPTAAVPTAAAPAVASPTPTRVLPTATPFLEKIQYGGVLRYAHRLQPDTMDPSFTGVADIYPIAFPMYDGLLQLDKDGQLMPLLAKSWDVSADGKVVTFNLQSGVKFHDGTTFNAQAVKWNFDRMLDTNEGSSRRAELGPYVKTTEAVDDTTFRLTMTQPYRPLLPLLASDRPGFLVSPAAVQKYGGGRGGNFGRNPVGAGPFKFVEWVPDDRVTLTKFDGYWQKDRPYLDGIRLQAIRDPNTRLAMLRTGETDIIWKLYVRPQDLPIINPDPNLRTLEIKGAQTVGLVFNTSIKPFDNKALRQAVAYAMDRDKFVKVSLLGYGSPAYTMEDSGWAQNANLKPITSDLAKAKAKLVEAGYSTGVTLPFACQATTDSLQDCEIYQAMMREAGINANIVQVEPSKMFGPTGIALKDIGFKSTGWSHRADPDIRLRWIYYPGGFYNIMNFNNPQISQLLDQAVATYDTAKAKPLYDQVQTLGAEEAVWVYVAWKSNFVAYRKAVRGYVTHTDIGERLQNLWLEK